MEERKKGEETEKKKDKRQYPAKQKTLDQMMVSLNVDLNANWKLFCN